MLQEHLLLLAHAVAQMILARRLVVACKCLQKVRWMYTLRALRILLQALDIIIITTTIIIIIIIITIIITIQPVLECKGQSYDGFTVSQFVIDL